MENSADSNKVSYLNAFGVDTRLDLYTTYSGLKEDIVLEKYNGQSLFPYKINFGGLEPMIKNNGILLNNAAGETVLEIPPIYVQDSSPEPRFTVNNSYSLSKQPDGSYIMTLVVDEAFLTDSATVYPVKVDPSFDRSSAYIDDATVYSNYPTSNFGTGTHMAIGNTATGGTACFYTKLNVTELKNSGVRYDNVLSAYYYFYTLENNEVTGVMQCQLVNRDWSESTITWNTRPGVEAQRIGTMNVYREGTASRGLADFRFFITSAVRAWLQDVPNYGLKFYERTNGPSKYFTSTESSSNRPCFVVKYIEDVPVARGEGVADNTVYRLRNKKSGLYLTNNGTNAYQAGYINSAAQQWRIKAVNNGANVTLTPQNATGSALSVYGASLSDESDIRIQPKYTGALYQQWRLVRNWDGSYRVTSSLLTDGGKGVVVQGGSTASGANVFLYTFGSPLEKNNYWTLEPVSKGNADFYDFTALVYGDQTTMYMPQSVSLAASMGFAASERTNRTAQEAYNRLTQTGIWFFYGHGSYSTAQFLYGHEIKAEGPNIPPSQYCVNQFSSTHLSSLWLLMFHGCLTGDNQPNSPDGNMIGIALKRGAHFVSGHPLETLNRHGEDYYANDTEICLVGPDWHVRFFMALKEGKTIYQAMDAADAYIYTYYGGKYHYGDFNERHTLGDNDLILYHP